MRYPLTMLLLLGSAGAEARTLGEIEFAPCVLAPKHLPVSVDAQCATVPVPENHADPDGRRIELALAWVPARGEAEPDPVFMLAGGPGQSARDSYPAAAAAFRDINGKRDVLLLDQRGTGGSQPLVCRDRDGKPAVADDVLDTSPAALRGFAARCAEELSAVADLRHYATSDAIADLEYIRGKLGAERINLVGVSYGTRVAQHYAMHYPERIRSLVLDGVVPNTQVLGAEHARNLENALQQQFERCEQTPACRSRLGSPRERLDRLAAELKQSPREVSYRDAVTGELRKDLLRYGHLSGVLRLYAYMPAMASMLPLILHEASEGDGAILMAQAEMLSGQIGDQINHGMQLAVICSEDAPKLHADDADHATVLGVEFVNFVREQCAVWPVEPPPYEFHVALQSDVPSLLLSGEFDPVTPPRYGDEVLNGLGNARHLTLRGQGHNVIGVGCMPKLVARFLESLDPAGLDTTCLDRVPYTPPFAGFYGWEP